MKTFCEDWEKLHKEMEWGRYPSEQVVRFVARNYYKKDRNKIKILDFGCGAGANTWFLAREGFDTYAFDGSESAIEKTKKNLLQEGIENVELEILDAVNIIEKYKENYFDCVIDNFCVYANTMDAIKIMYQNIYYILCVTGKIFTVCFGEETLGYTSGIELEKETYRNVKEGILSNRGIVHIFKKEEIHNLLKEIGFKNIKIEEMKYSDNGNIVHMYMTSAEK